MWMSSRRRQHYDNCLSVSFSVSGEAGKFFTVFSPPSSVTLLPGWRRQLMIRWINPKSERKGLDAIKGGSCSSIFGCCLFFCFCWVILISIIIMCTSDLKGTTLSIVVFVQSFASLLQIKSSEFAIRKRYMRDEIRKEGKEWDFILISLVILPSFAKRKTILIKLVIFN